MTVAISLIIGVIFGSLGTAAILNRYYRSEVWTMRKAIMLERLLVMKKRAEIQSNEAQARIDTILRGQMKD